MQFRIGETVIHGVRRPLRGKRNSRVSGWSSPLRTMPRPSSRFKGLADGGQVQMPLAKTFFSSSFGMVADRFGVKWMILVKA